VVIGAPQTIGRPEAIGAPQTIGQPQVIGGAASQVEGRSDAAGGPPAPSYYGDYTGTGDATGGSSGVMLESEPLDPGVEVRPMTEAELQAMEAVSGPDSEDGQAPASGGGAGSASDGSAGQALDPLAQGADPSQVPPVQEVQDPEATVDGTFAQSSAEGTTAESNAEGTSAQSNAEGTSAQLAPGFILGPTAPSSGAMLGDTTGTGRSGATGGSGAVTGGGGNSATGGGGAAGGGQTSTAPEAPVLDTLESIESSGVRSEELQTQQLGVLEDLAAQSEADRLAREAAAASLEQSQRESARAMSLVDQASREALSGETDLSDVLGLARTSVVEAADAAASRGDAARQDQLGRALLWIEAARVAGENHDGVEAMRQLEQARLELNGIVPSVEPPVSP